MYTKNKIKNKHKLRAWSANILHTLSSPSNLLDNLYNATLDFCK